MPKHIAKTKVVSKAAPSKVKKTTIPGKKRASILPAILVAILAVLLVGSAFFMANSKRSTDARSDASGSNQEQGLVPVVRLNRDKTFLYTASPTEFQQAIRNGWTTNGRAFSAFSSPGRNLVAVYRFSNAKDFLYTIYKEEGKKAAQQGYNYDGVAFYVYLASSSKGVPVYRLYNKSLGIHVYTIHTAERDKAVKDGYILEGVAFRARQ
jgi:hypothetical protein